MSGTSAKEWLAQAGRTFYLEFKGALKLYGTIYVVSMIVALVLIVADAIWRAGR